MMTARAGQERPSKILLGLLLSAIHSPLYQRREAELTTHARTKLASNDTSSGSRKWAIRIAAILSPEVLQTEPP